MTREKRKKSRRRRGLEKEEEVGGQEKENRIKGVEEGSSSFSLVAFSVGTGVL